jgi:hypothetical protein
VVHSLFHFLPGLTDSLGLAKETEQKKRARDGERLLEFMSQWKGKTCCAQAVSASFSSQQNPRRHQERGRSNRIEVGAALLAV